MSRIFIFDTETTGLLNAKATNLSEQPYIIEIYGCVIDEEFNLHAEIEHLIKPPIPLPDIITKITKLTDDDLKDARPFNEIVPELSRVVTGCDAIVAHNLEFDKSMLANDLLRAGMLLNFPWPRHHICTVEKSMPIHGHRLKMSQLHQEMTGKGFADAHRAKNDVHALVRAFHGLTEKGYIDLKVLEK